MRRLLGASGVVALLALAVAATTMTSTASTEQSDRTSQADSRATLPDFRQLVEANSAGVVNISTTQAAGPAHTAMPGLPFDELPPGSPWRDFFRHFGDGLPAPREARSLGSGFVIAADGLIMTNAHVVDGADSIVVTLADRTEHAATVVGLDRTTDVAVLRIDADDLKPVRLGDSDRLQVGEWVLAIGSPFGLDHTATQGIVSAVGRSLPDETYVPFIQTDVAVNPGNSGGPLFNTAGEVIGVNSQIYSRSGGYMGLSFAIPINTARQVADQLVADGHVTRGWLGVQIQGMSGDLARTFGLEKPEGALVAMVDPDGPAAKAGLRSGDVILSFDGHRLGDSTELPPLVARAEIGSRVPVDILRDGRHKTVKVRIGTLPSDLTAAQEAGSEEAEQRATLNVSVAELPPQLRERLKIERGGALVAEVRPGPAARAGVQPGDVILAIDGQDVSGPQALGKLADKLPRGKPFALLIQRDEARLFLAMTVPQSGEEGKAG